MVGLDGEPSGSAPDVDGTLVGIHRASRMHERGWRVDFYKSRRRVLSDLLADTTYPCNRSGKRLPINFIACVLPRRKALGVKWNQVFTVVLESDLHRHLVPVHCVAAHAAGFAVSGPKPCCADRPASGQLATMNGVSLRDFRLCRAGVGMAKPSKSVWNR